MTIPLAVSFASRSTTIPETVCIVSGFRSKTDTTRVRSSTSRGRLSSRSSTRSRFSFANNSARAGPTPRTNCTGVCNGSSVGSSGMACEV